MRRLLMTLGFLLVAVAALASWAEFSPLAAIADSRRAALVLAAVSVLLFASLAWRTRSSRRGAIVGLAVSIVAMGFAAKLLFFTYQEDELAFDSRGITLRGTLFAPRSAGRHPAVVYLHDRP
ncbi:MAG: hypothetical protein ACRD0X_04640 [Thermoanaerobaculia bacterium]